MLNNKAADLAEIRKRIQKTAEQCVSQSRGERPELRLLKEIYERRREEYGLGKTEMDALIYERIYGSPPQKASDTLKIRYWRTGHHYPVNRRLCMAFARSLELNEDESRWLLTAWMDKSLYFNEKTPPGDDLCYWERQRRFYGMVKAYFKRHATAEKDFSYGGFRHCYYLEALKYAGPDGTAAAWKESIYSVNYDSELKRSVLLLGEIPRKTMLRHLILLNLPELTLEKLQRDLLFFGYLPLMPEHTTTRGEYLDRLVLEVISLYELVMGKYGAAEAEGWFRGCWRELDRRFAAEKRPGFRLFYFKSLG